MKNDLHLVCPHCQSINRVPTAKLSEHPNCGRCQQPLFTGEPIELTTATFSRHVERSDLPLLVDFWAPEPHHNLWSLPDICLLTIRQPAQIPF
ncbi:thioredoxin [Pseudomonas aeruginosa PA38182]|nr:thioredoxin [Pseudomonas aeruginosa PA38182]